MGLVVRTPVRDLQQTVSTMLGRWLVYYIYQSPRLWVQETVYALGSLVGLFHLLVLSRRV